MPSALGVELGPRSRGSFSSSCVLVGMGNLGLLSPWRPGGWDPSLCCLPELVVIPENELDRWSWRAVTSASKMEEWVSLLKMREITWHLIQLCVPFRVASGLYFTTFLMSFYLAVSSSGSRPDSWWLPRVGTWKTMSGSSPLALILPCAQPWQH